MNTKVTARDELELISAAASALSNLGLNATVQAAENRVRAGTTHDAILIIRGDGRAAKYKVEAKPTVTRATLGALLFRYENPPEDFLIVTEYLTPPVAEEFRRHNIQFVDSAGNAFLRRRGLLVFVSGRKALKPTPPERTSRAFQESGLKLVFALLSRSDLANHTFREIAADTGVALGTVHWVMQDLRQLGFLAEIRRRRRLLDRERLIAEWTEAYSRVLRPKLLLGRFGAPTPSWWSAARIERYGAVWGGEVAAERLTHMLKPGVATVYASSLPHSLIVEHRLKPDSEGTVEIRRRFWRFDDNWQERGLAPPLLIYADLIAVGDSRSVETAHVIYDRYLIESHSKN